MNAWHKAAAMALGLAAILSFAATPARAGCQGEEFDISEYDDPVWTYYLPLIIATSEQYFHVTFAATCMDPADPGAFVRKDTLVLGVPYLKKMGDLSFNHVTAIIAHETAHRFQIANNVLNENLVGGQVKCIELLADFMAGGFMRWRTKDTDVSAEAIATLFFEMGDPHVGHRDHHGLGQERLIAFAQGFSELYEDVNYNWAQGMQYVDSANCNPS